MPQQDLTPFEFAPGMDKDKTPYEVGAGFVGGNYVRFHRGKPEKMGGWVLWTAETIPGVPRDILSWETLVSDKLLAVATNERVEIFANSQFYDVTPFISNVSATDGIDTSIGSTLVTVDFPSNLLDIGDTFVFTSAPATVGGNVVLTDSEYTVVSASSNSIVIDSGTTAAATSTSAGGPYQGGGILPGGFEYNTLTGGYGSGTYGSGAYGSTTTVSGTGVILPMRQWTLGNFGQDLLMNPRGGRLYDWDPTNGLGTRAVLVSASPSVVNTFIVTPTTRQVMAFGCTNEAGTFDPLAYRWSDEENFNQWNTSATSQAGEDRVDEGTQFMGAVASKGEIVGITDTAAYRIFNNVPGTWGKQLLSKTSGLISQHALIDVDGTSYWMGSNGFYMYDGVVQTMINGYNETLFTSGQTDRSDSSIAIELTQKEMIFCGINKTFHEIIWFYPTLGNTYCNHYIIYNYLEKVWYDGTIDRSVWEDADVFEKPLSLNRAGQVYQHEVGYNDNNVPLSAWIATGIMDINQGDQIAFIDKMVPDFELVGNTGHFVTLRTKKYPQAAAFRDKTYVVLQNSGKVSVRQRGRQFQIIWLSNGLDTFFRFGKPRFAISPDGEN